MEGDGRPIFLVMQLLGGTPLFNFGITPEEASKYSGVTIEQPRFWFKDMEYKYAGMQIFKDGPQVWRNIWDITKDTNAGLITFDTKLNPQLNLYCEGRGVRAIVTSTKVAESSP